MSYKDYIVSDHRIMLGKPVIRGTRLTVELILRKLSEGIDSNAMLKMYPALTVEAIFAVLQYAADVVANEENLESIS